MRFFPGSDKQGCSKFPEACAAVTGVSVPWRREPIAITLQAFPFQLLPPRVGQLENAALIGPLLFGEADAAVTIARTGPGKRDPEQEPVRPLARTMASDGDIRHGR